MVIKHLKIRKFQVIIFPNYHDTNNTISHTIRLFCRTQQIHYWSKEKLYQLLIAYQLQGNNFYTNQSIPIISNVKNLMWKLYKLKSSNLTLNMEFKHGRENIFKILAQKLRYKQPHVLFEINFMEPNVNLNLWKLIL